MTETELPLTLTAHLMGILRGLMDAAVVVDRNLRPLMWNDAYVALTGLRPKAFAKAAGVMPCHGLFTLEVCATDCLAKRAFETERLVRYSELHGSSPAAPDQRTLIVSTIPVNDDAGTCIAALETYRDVTAEARIQSRYKVLLDEERRRAELLEQAVEARTKELQASLRELTETRAQLVRREKLSALGNFVAGIAHELNNPINFVYGNIDTVEARVKALRSFWDEVNGLLEPAQRERVAALAIERELAEDAKDLDDSLAGIAAGAERAARIIKDLRSVILGGSSERTIVRIADAAQAAFNIARGDMPSNVALREAYDASCVAVANQSQIVQVILNLLHNARDAIGTRDGSIALTVARREEGVVIEVADTGPGISDDEQLRIFDPFYTTKGAAGMGLGLSLSQSIVEGHGGRLGVQSRAGEGATFTVWLPGGAA